MTAPKTSDANVAYFRETRDDAQVLAILDPPSPIDEAFLRLAIKRILGLTDDDLNGLAAGTYVVFPRYPTKAMWAAFVAFGEQRETGFEHVTIEADFGNFAALIASLIEARNKP